MKTQRVWVHAVFLANLVVLGGHAQVQFSTESLPHRVGDYYRGYLSTNVSVSAMVTPAGGPQRWDLSQPRQPNETIQRTDVVPSDEAGQDTGIPEAAYAERDTLDPANPTAWRYYTLTDEGRLYYGFYATEHEAGKSLVVFDQPTLDVPATVQYGQTWNRSVSWQDSIMGVSISYDFTASARVDAYGTLVLAGLGQMPALRVKEIHDYEVSVTGWQVIDSHTNLFYYWLCPGIGMPLQVILYGSNIFVPTPLDYTNLVLRTFETSAPTNPPMPAPVADLRIGLQGGRAVLNWRPATNGSGYRVESLPWLGYTNWQLLGLPATSGWSEALTPTQRFYRVFWLP
jgi:hypothetical protein